MVPQWDGPRLGECAKVCPIAAWFTSPENHLCARSRGFLAATLGQNGCPGNLRLKGRPLASRPEGEIQLQLLVGGGSMTEVQWQFCTAEKKTF